MGNTPPTPVTREPRVTRSGPPRQPSYSQMIPDNFSSLEQVTAALRRYGLEGCNLIVGVDFTKSNEWSGKRTFGGRSLHDTSDPNVRNPYEEVIDIIGRTLKDFDDDNIIPCYGFGDELTVDKSVFSFAADERSGFPLEGIRQRYREILPSVVMAGPTSFAPIIHQAVNIVNRSGGYHILVIIADGQVTRPADVPPRAVSKNEKETIDAITYASNFPLSIIMVGVGDGPWDAMIYFDNYLMNRRFDNFQFVEFHKITNQFSIQSKREAQFALQALMEIPEQYQTIKQMRLLDRGAFGFRTSIVPVDVFPPPVPPSSPLYRGPSNNYQPDNSTFSFNYPQYPPPQHTSNAQPMPDPAYPAQAMPSTGAFQPPTQPQAEAKPTIEPSAPVADPYETKADCKPPSLSRAAEKELERLQETMLCCICEERSKNMVFNCGHETCGICAERITQCPICREDIRLRIKRYG